MLCHQSGAFSVRLLPTFYLGLKFKGVGGDIFLRNVCFYLAKSNKLEIPRNTPKYYKLMKQIKGP